ncbi:hypothetical protein LINGRAPRIM_LOCUS1953 [Linum grandiflorum]
MMGYQGCNITHVKREADCLAKSGYSTVRDEIWFSNPPSNVQHLVAADIVGKKYRRGACY